MDEKYRIVILANHRGYDMAIPRFNFTIKLWGNECDYCCAICEDESYCEDSCMNKSQEIYCSECKYNEKEYDEIN